MRKARLLSVLVMVTAVNVVGDMCSTFGTNKANALTGGVAFGSTPGYANAAPSGLSPKDTAPGYANAAPSGLSPKDTAP
ncbi:MAG: hypothetical protein LUB62_04805, partial [Prevotellaceae bacterium]|nr:hypothetical protein [Prevotellaceae bacterium]